LNHQQQNALIVTITVSLAADNEVLLCDAALNPPVRPCFQGTGKIRGFNGYDPNEDEYELINYEETSLSDAPSRTERSSVKHGVRYETAKYDCYNCATDRCFSGDWGEGKECRARDECTSLTTPGRFFTKPGFLSSVFLSEVFQKNGRNKRLNERNRIF
jgi:hypothetical protein